MKLDINNSLAIGTDNASIMIGIVKGEYEKLKVDVPSLILVTCACHTIQLAISHASPDYFQE